MWKALAIAACGCGRIGFGAHGDAPPGDAVAIDACAFGPWSAPTRIAELSSASDDTGPHISSDALTLYFASARVNVGDLFVATRPDRASPFAPPMNLGSVNGSNRDLNPTVTGDQLELYFDSDRTGGAYCLYTATRASIGAAWSAVGELPSLCTPQAGGPYITPDGLSLYYGVHDNTSFLGTLMVATRASRADSFSPSTPVAFTAAAARGYPALTTDQLTIFFHAPSGTTEELWQATRPAVDHPFGGDELVSVDDATSDNEDASITSDGLELFFASDRAGGAGGFDLYHATRSCL